MKVLFNQCLDCGLGKSCYESGFERCPKIEKAGEGLGIPVRQKDNSWFTNIPFGVYMALKHILANSMNIARSPKVGINQDMPEMKYPRVDFAKRLATETVLTHDEASVLVAEISLYGDIKDAIECYEVRGLKALKLYLAGRKTLLRMGVD